MLDEYGVRLNVLGRIEMLPENVQESVRIAQEMTKKNNKYAVLELSAFTVILTARTLDLEGLSSISACLTPHGTR